MMHFDFQVGDLDSAVADAVRSGRFVGYGSTSGERPGAPRPSRATPSASASTGAERRRLLARHVRARGSALLTISYFPVKIPGM